MKSDTLLLLGGLAVGAYVLSKGISSIGQAFNDTAFSWSPQGLAGTVQRAATDIVAAIPFENSQADLAYTINNLIPGAVPLASYVPGTLKADGTPFGWFQ